MKQIFFVMSILLTLQLSAQTLKVPKFTKIVKVVAKDVGGDDPVDQEVEYKVFIKEY